MQHNQVWLAFWIQIKDARRIEIQAGARHPVGPRKKAVGHVTGCNDIVAGLGHREQVGQVAGTAKQAAGQVLVLVVDISGIQDLGEREGVAEPVEDL